MNKTCFWVLGIFFVRLSRIKKFAWSFLFKQTWEQPSIQNVKEALCRQYYVSVYEWNSCFQDNREPAKVVRPFICDENLEKAEKCGLNCWRLSTSCEVHHEKFKNWKRLCLTKEESPVERLLKKWEIRTSQAKWSLLMCRTWNQWQQNLSRNCWTND